jgi:hypothetical protein
MTRLMLTLRILVIGLLSGCSTSPPVRLYLIEATALAEPAREAQALIIAVRPVQLAEHLNRREILTRSEPFRVSAAQFDRWAEPIDRNIAAVLAENLVLLVPTNSVHTYPRDTVYQADYSVRIHILSYGAQPDNEVVLKVVWTVEDSTGRRVRHVRSQYSAPRRDAEVVSLVEALSRNVEQLSRDIANAINEANLE